MYNITTMIENVLLISADFPKIYCQFVKAFKNNGCNVFVIGSTQIEKLEPTLKIYVTEYIQTYEMENIGKMIEIVGGLINKYGPIDFLESNNEYWLRNDAILREWFNIRTGIFPSELDNYQKKSWMKKAFINANANVAPFTMATSFESVKEFADKYGYPIFTKPDIGVGSAGNFKINNEEELAEFFKNKPKVDYIVETFVEGRIITFDGIVDGNGTPVVQINEIYQREVYSLITTKEDMYYYINKIVPEKLSEIGCAVVKSLGIKNRFFHIEFFIAENSVEGYFSKGDYVVLEANIRTPGDYTVDVLNYALDTNLYQMYADVICFGRSDVTIGNKKYAMCVSRRKGKQYFFSDEDIKRTYGKEIVEVGEYPLVYEDLIGNFYYTALFDKEEDALLFSDYVRKTNVSSYSHGERISHITGEDRRMLDERKRENDSSDLNICDKHIDGA